MRRKKVKKRRKKKNRGIEVITEPGVGSLFVRSPWMKKLDELDKGKNKQFKKYDKLKKKII